jgi:4-hydroxy-3-methylbut-2-enyl diphosphate reductase
VIDVYGLLLPHIVPEGEVPLSIEQVDVAGNRTGCGGVKSAEDTLRLARMIVPEDVPIYINHDITHNDLTVDHFATQNVINFDNDFSRVPHGALTVFSPHGVTPEHYQIAEERGLQVLDTTCTFVYKEQIAGQKAARRGAHTLYVGKKDHPEAVSVEAFTRQVTDAKFTLVSNPNDVEGLIFDEDEHYHVISQTTHPSHIVEATVRAIQERSPDVTLAKTMGEEGKLVDNFGSLCYATVNRQAAVKQLIRDQKVDALLVMGGEFSSNTNALVQLAKDYAEEIRPDEIGVAGFPAFRLSTGNKIEREWFTPDIRRVGITGSASATEAQVRHAAEWFDIRGIPIMELPETVNEGERKHKFNARTIATFTQLIDTYAQSEEQREELDKAIKS